MGAVNYKIILLAICLMLGSCLVLEKGYVNEYGHYVPKHPRFKLKNKQGVFPVMLDTTAVYKLIDIYNKGQKVDLSLSAKYDQYLKFFSFGKYMRIVIPAKDSLGNINSIKEEDLNPIKAIKGYYFSSDGKNLQVENFVYGEGYGCYVILDYKFDISGDTLYSGILYSSGVVFKKETIPTNWNKYKIDW